MNRRRIVGAVLIVIAVLAVTLFVGYKYLVKQLIDESNDPGKNSYNIHLSGTITPSGTHPLNGFWKSDCNENFGLAIAAAGPSNYSVSFCGPSGCFKPGYYRPNTPILGDPEYRVDTSLPAISLRSQDGKELQFKKCWPPKGGA